MARSGGTMVGKCIACMDNISLLSEVSPLTFIEKHNPVSQAIRFHQLLNQDDIQELKQMESISWLNAIEFVYERAQRQGKHLVLRDWSHLDFTGIPWFPNPAYKSTTAYVLDTHFDVKKIATVRHPIDQWLSLSKLDIAKGNITIEKFLKGYLAFAKYAVEIGFIRFEDFTQRPEHYSELICRQLEIPYDADFINKWSAYKKITGDMSIKSQGRATHTGKVQTLAKAVISAELTDKLNASADFRESMKLLGYEE